jgi:putative FmdB family regulatory protein
MPTYDYICHHCGHRFEVIHGVHTEGPSTCPVCGSHQVLKAVTAPAVHYKGSGWAKKDRGASARKSSSGTEEKPAAATGEGGTDTKSKPADASSESKPADASSESKPSKTPTSDSSTLAAKSGSSSD